MSVRGGGFKVNLVLGHRFSLFILLSVPLCGLFSYSILHTLPSIFAILTVVVAAWLRLRLLKDKDSQGFLAATENAVAKRAVYLATRSRFSVFWESYNASTSRQDAQLVTNMLRGIPPRVSTEYTEESERRATERILSGVNPPTVREVSNIAAMEERREISRTSSRIETAFTLLQGIGFFLPLILIIFAPRLGQTFVDGAYISLAYFLLLDGARRRLKPF